MLAFLLSLLMSAHCTPGGIDCHHPPPDPPPMRTCGDRLAAAREAIRRGDKVSVEFAKDVMKECRGWRSAAHRRNRAQ